MAVEALRRLRWAHWRSRRQTWTTWTRPSVGARGTRRALLRFTAASMLVDAALGIGGIAVSR